MVLDLYDHTGQLSDLQRYISIPISVVEGFRQRFPKVDPKTGKTDMFPSQVGHPNPSIERKYISSLSWDV